MSSELWRPQQLQPNPFADRRARSALDFQTTRFSPIYPQQQTSPQHSLKAGFWQTATTDTTLTKLCSHEWTLPNSNNLPLPRLGPNCTLPATDVLHHALKPKHWFPRRPPPIAAHHHHRHPHHLKRPPPMTAPMDVPLPPGFMLSPIPNEWVLKRQGRTMHEALAPRSEFKPKCAADYQYLPYAEKMVISISPGMWNRGR